MAPQTWTVNNSKATHSDLPRSRHLNNLQQGLRHVLPMRRVEKKRKLPNTWSQRRIHMPRKLRDFKKSRSWKLLVQREIQLTVIFRLDLWLETRKLCLRLELLGIKDCRLKKRFSKRDLVGLAPKRATCLEGWPWHPHNSIWVAILHLPVLVRPALLEKHPYHLVLEIEARRRPLSNPHSRTISSKISVSMSPKELFKMIRPRKNNMNKFSLEHLTLIPTILANSASEIKKIAICLKVRAGILQAWPHITNPKHICFQTKIHCMRIKMSTDTSCLLILWNKGQESILSRLKGIRASA